MQLYFAITLCCFGNFVSDKKYACLLTILGDYLFIYYTFRIKNNTVCIACHPGANKAMINHPTIF